MATNNFLITGAGGFVGSFLVPKLLADGHQVCALDMNVGSLAELVKTESIRFIKSNLNDSEQLKNILLEHGISCVIHMAAARHANTLHEIFQQNLLSTAHLLDAVRLSGLQIRLIQVSSSAVYGNPSADEPIDEKAPVQPITPYGSSKAATDMMTMQWALEHGMDVIIARPFNLIGPGQGPQFFCAKVIDQLIQVEKSMGEFMLGNLTTVRDFLDVRDFVAGLSLLIDAPQAREVYNLCSGKATPLTEVMDFALKKLGRKVALGQRQDQARNAQDVRFQVGSFAKMQAHTEWQPRYTLDQSLNNMLEHARRFS